MKRVRTILRKWKGYLLRQEDGIGTVEVILILVVLIALVVIFREQILSLIDGIFENINSSVNALY